MTDNRNSISERDLYFADQPKVLLSKYTIPEIESLFGPLDDQTYLERYSLDDYDLYLDQVLQNIWKKYGRLDVDRQRGIYDWVRGEFIPLADFDLDNYSLMALQRLQQEIKGLPEFRLLDQEIGRRITQALQTDGIVTKVTFVTRELSPY